jgi:hypothetical protein
MMFVPTLLPTAAQEGLSPASIPHEAFAQLPEMPQVRLSPYHQAERIQISMLIIQPPDDTRVKRI